MVYGLLTFGYVVFILWIPIHQGTIVRNHLKITCDSTSYSVLLLGDIIRCAESADLKNGCSQSSLAMHELYFEMIMTILQSD